MRKEMMQAFRELAFERAAELRDMILNLRNRHKELTQLCRQEKL
jgi:excinuclease UvrABC helicase subunit UvrB